MFKMIFENVRNSCPLIHNITNYVTVNDCANIVLACGASPIMADDKDEVAEITTICSGLNINIGTLNSRTIDSMLIAGKKANELGHPVVLDPVGAGASKLRTDTAMKLLEEVKFTVIRGNISEIKTLASGNGSTKGVDADVADKVTEENLEEVINGDRLNVLYHLDINEEIDIKEDKEIELKLDEERNIVWATQNEIAKLFNVGRNWITRQIKQEEKKEEYNPSVCSYLEHTGPDNKTYNVKHYSLDLILEIGYKIDVNKTLEFKDWVFNLLNQNLSLETYKTPMPVEIFEDGDVKLDVYINPDEDTIWLTQEQISMLFKTDRSSVSKHIKNILEDEELDESNVQKLHIPFSDKQVKVYNSFSGCLTNNKEVKFEKRI